jgi:hypothetical protein
MKLIMDFNNLVIIGLWNRHIFSPEWVGKYLLPDTELTAEYPLNIAGSFRISTDKIRLFVLGNRLQFVPLQPEQAVFDLIQDLSLNVGTFLPHTPVSAFGVNFLFETETTELITNIFAVPDIGPLEAAGFRTTGTSYRHSFQKDGRDVNLSISLDRTKVRFDFNNNFEIKSLTEFKERISKTTIVEMLREAETMVSTVYLKN